MLARVRAALVHVHLTTFPGVTGPAVAYELIETVLATYRVQRARVAGTLVDVGQAPGPIVTARALASPAGYQVHAAAAVDARAACALVHVHLAMQTGETGEAIARVPDGARNKREIYVAVQYICGGGGARSGENRGR